MELSQESGVISSAASVVSIMDADSASSDEENAQDEVTESQQPHVASQVDSYIEQLQPHTHLQVRAWMHEARLKNSFKGATFDACCRVLALHRAKAAPLKYYTAKGKHALLSSASHSHLQQLTLQSLAALVPPSARRNYELHGVMKLPMPWSPIARAMLQVGTRLHAAQLGAIPEDSSTYQHAGVLPCVQTKFGWIRRPAITMSHWWVATHPVMYIYTVAAHAIELLLSGKPSTIESVRACLELRLQTYNSKLNLPSPLPHEFSHVDGNWKWAGFNVPAPQCMVSTSPSVVGDVNVFDCHFINLDTPEHKLKMANSVSLTCNERQSYNLPRLEHGGYQHASSCPSFCNFDDQNMSYTPCPLAAGDAVIFRHCAAHRFRQFGIPDTEVGNFDLCRTSEYPSLFSPALLGTPNQSVEEVLRALSGGLLAQRWAHPYTGNPQVAEDKQQLPDTRPYVGLSIRTPLQECLVGVQDWTARPQLMEMLCDITRRIEQQPSAWYSALESSQHGFSALLDLAPDGLVNLLLHHEVLAEEYHRNALGVLRELATESSLQSSLMQVHQVCNSGMISNLDVEYPLAVVRAAKHALAHQPSMDTAACNAARAELSARAQAIVERRSITAPSYLCDEDVGSDDSLDDSLDGDMGPESSSSSHTSSTVSVVAEAAQSNAQLRHVPVEIVPSAASPLTAATASPPLDVHAENWRLRLLARLASPAHLETALLRPIPDRVRKEMPADCDYVICLGAATYRTLGVSDANAGYAGKFIASLLQSVRGVTMRKSPLESVRHAPLHTLVMCTSEGLNGVSRAAATTTAFNVDGRIRVAQKRALEAAGHTVCRKCHMPVIPVDAPDREPRLAEIAHMIANPAFRCPDCVQFDMLIPCIDSMVPGAEDL